MHHSGFLFVPNHVHKPVVGYVTTKYFEIAPHMINQIVINVYLSNSLLFEVCHISSISPTSVTPSISTTFVSPLILTIPPTLITNFCFDIDICQPILVSIKVDINNERKVDITYDRNV